MPIRLAINGFGRIGKMVFRKAITDPEIEIAFINDLFPAETLAYLLKYDSVHGTLNKKVTHDEDCIYVDEKRYKVVACKDPKDLPYDQFPVDFVVESTGIFTKMEAAKAHLARPGERRVVISAPSDAPMFVMGVNQHRYDPGKHRIVSNASCTTNGLAPIAKVLHESFGIIEGLMSTIHATTASQPTVDLARPKDLRGSRSAMINTIPASTGAAKAVTKIIPELEGKLTGMAFRVPVTNVSVIDLTVRLEKKTSYDEICKVMKSASEKHLKGILGYTDEPVVSSDFNGSSLSSIFDATAGIELNSQFFKIIAWYDNEWGYASRIVDLIHHMKAVE